MEIFVGFVLICLFLIILTGTIAIVLLLIDFIRDLFD